MIRSLSSSRTCCSSAKGPGTSWGISDKQVATLGRVLTKYRDQIENFDARAKELQLPAGNGKNEAKETDITCPECKEGKLAEKRYRGRAFYGCNQYPKCRYTVSSLDKLKEEGGQTAGSAE